MYNMYEYVEDKQFLSRIRGFSGEVMQDLCHILKEEYDIGARFHLIGSGGKNLVMKNASGKVDLDYDLEIVRCKNPDDCNYLRECTKRALLKASNYKRYFTFAYSESKSVITLYCGNDRTHFSIDICIIRRMDSSNYYRLIRIPTNLWCYKYIWNEAKHSSKIKRKANYIKSKGKWELVRIQYRDIKNRYYSQTNEEHHPSFICYIEAVNNVYNSIKNL